MGKREQAKELIPAIPPQTNLEQFRDRDPMELAGLELQAIAREVCVWVAEGGNLADLCNKYGLFRRTVFAAINATEDTIRDYHLARIVAADFIAAEVLTIADNDSEDVYIDDKRNEKPNKEFIARSNIRIEARKWYLKHLDPERYGDRMNVKADVKNTIKIEQITGVKILPPDHGNNI